VGGTLRVQPPLLQQPPWRIAGRRRGLGIDRQRHDVERHVSIGVRCSVVGLVREQIGHVRRGIVIEAGDEGRDAGVGLHLRGIEVEFAPPDQAGLLAQIDDLLEEALKDVDAEALADAGEAGVIGQFFVEGVAEVPAMGEVEIRGLDELPLGADALEEHDQLQLEKHHRVDAGPASPRIQLPGPVTDEAKIQRHFEVAVEVVGGNEIVE
jgi:hypothetical protein